MSIALIVILVLGLASTSQGTDAEKFGYKPGNIIHCVTVNSYLRVSTHGVLTEYSLTVGDTE